MNTAERLLAIEQIVNFGLDADGATRILDLMGASAFPQELVEETRLYSECLARAEEFGFSQEQWYLHFLLDVLDKMPVAEVDGFADSFREVVARRLMQGWGEDINEERHLHVAPAGAASMDAQGDSPGC